MKKLVKQSGRKEMASASCLANSTRTPKRIWNPTLNGWISLCAKWSVMSSRGRIGNLDQVSGCMILIQSLAQRVIAGIDSLIKRERTVTLSAQRFTVLHSPHPQLNSSSMSICFQLYIAEIQRLYLVSKFLLHLVLRR